MLRSPASTMRFERPFPGIEFLDGERIALAHLVEGQPSGAHRLDGAGLARHRPALAQFGQRGNLRHGILPFVLGGRLAGRRTPQVRIFRTKPKSRIL